MGRWSKTTLTIVSHYLQYVAEHQKAWDIYVALLWGAYNVHAHRSTHLTRFNFNLSRLPPGPAPLNGDSCATRRQRYRLADCDRHFVTNCASLLRRLAYITIQVSRKCDKSDADRRSASKRHVSLVITCLPTGSS